MIIDKDIQFYIQSYYSISEADYLLDYLSSKDYNKIIKRCSIYKKKMMDEKKSIDDDNIICWALDDYISKENVFDNYDESDYEVDRNEYCI